MSGLSKAEMVRNTCFQSNIVSVTYGLTRKSVSQVQMSANTRNQFDELKSVSLIPKTSHLKLKFSIKKHLPTYAGLGFNEQKFLGCHTWYSR